MDNDDPRRFYGWRPYGKVTERQVVVTTSSRDRARCKIEQDVESFLANGGKIEQVAHGVTGFKETRNIRVMRRR